MTLVLKPLRSGMTPADPPIPSATFTTGIRGLDVVLKDHLERGKYLLFCAQEGGGKTILATQFAGYAVQADQNVLMISTEVLPKDFHLRMASSFCNYDCERKPRILDGIVFEDHFDDPNIQIPKLDVYPEDFPACYMKLRVLLDEHLAFRRVESLTYDPPQLLRKTLRDYEHQKKRPPDMMILDYIVAPYDKSRRGMDVHEARKAVFAASKAMKALAEEFDLLSVAFCQADVEASGDSDPTCIQEYNQALAEPADAFIGLSKRLPGPGEPSRGDFGTPALRQTLYVQIRGRQAEILPVDTNYLYQRCEDPKEDVEVTATHPTEETEAEPGDSEAVAAILRKQGGARGYVLMSRLRFEQILDLGNPNCVNIYVLLLLAANYGERDLIGASFWGRGRIAEKLGLSIKRVRTALDVLETNGFIMTGSQTGGNRRGRALCSEITAWKEDQDAKTATNYFKLFRILLTASNAPLTGNPDMLRLWVYFLVRARGVDDNAAHLKRGAFVLSYQEIEERLHIDSQKAADLIESLERDGRVFRSTGFDGAAELNIKNWSLYQDEVHPPKDAEPRKPGSRSWAKEPGLDPEEAHLRALADEMTAEFQEREQEARANSGQTEGKL